MISPNRQLDGKRARDYLSKAGYLLRRLRLYPIAIRMLLGVFAVRKFPRYLLAFGLLDGLKLLFQLRVRFHPEGATIKLRIPGAAHPFELRGGADINVFEQVFVRNQYELPASFDPSFIIDGGAHIGCASVYFALRYPKAKIIAIEPEAGNFRLMERNTRAYPNISRIQAGLWAMSSTLSIVDERAESWAFRVAARASSKSAAIRAITMNDLLEQSGTDRIDLLKLDVEGAEKEIFSGDCFRWLGRVRVLMIEMHDRITPGCTDAVRQALALYDFVEERNGECHVLIRSPAAREHAQLSKCLSSELGA